MPTPFRHQVGDLKPFTYQLRIEQVKALALRICYGLLEFWNTPGRFRWPLFLIALLGAFASVAMLRSSFNLDVAPQSDVSTKQREVIVAKQSLSPGDVLTRENLAVGRVPEDYFEASMLSPDRFPDVDGLVMTQTLAPGQALSTNHVVKTERRHPSLGLRRIQLVLEDRYGFKQLPLPGDFVDFYWQISHGQQLGLHSTDIGSYLVEDVRLVSIKRAADPGPQSLSRRSEKTSWIHIEVEVLPEPALRLLKASALGALQMVLRNPDDRSSGPTVNKPESQRRDPAPAKLMMPSGQRVAPPAEVAQKNQVVSEKSKDSPSLGNRVEVIRGGQRSIEQTHQAPANQQNDRTGSARESEPVNGNVGHHLSGHEARELIERIRRLSETGSTQAGLVQ
ncbi:MAG: Flp pilus assembly protein CpaB [Betaproteobacteria bacterium]|nr:Flp pilus assembly protein CpaB [Betaproteobacteria bacterium]